ncbi:MAG: hypothetical protein IKZ09_06025, partial [Clostridia bacterium]|nr:hypothetical protein [Clostridia bacterium]
SLMEDPCGAYALCDEESKAAYRRAVTRLAKKQNTSEEAAAKSVLHAAKTAAHEDDRHIAFHLFPAVDDRRGILLHILGYAAAVVLSFCAALWIGNGFGQRLTIGCALYLPLYALVREGAADIAWRLFGKRALPVLRYRIARGQIPDDALVLTITTALLRDAEGGSALVRNLERFYLRNRDRNAYFGLLCDLPSADAEVKDGDGALIDAVKAQINALNRKWGEHFCLFVRRRQYSAGEKCYMGWERKRGAVLMLSRLLRGIGAESFVCTVMPTACKGSIRYVCTLDEDTELPPDALHVMVGAMLHPHNRPIIKDGGVRRGCAILQPDMAVTLRGAAASRFTLLCTGKGGADPYSRDRIDTDAILYGTGSFCGKGMFDVDAFLAVLDGAFPDHAVLSHDFLEGARLGCRNFPAVTLSDSIPTTPQAYFARQSRWVRGDVQALRFAFSSHRNAKGELVKNPISVTDRLRIVDHALHALTPPAMLRAILVAAFLPISGLHLLWFLGLLFSPYLLRPITLCLRPWAWRSFGRQFFGAVYTDLRQALYWLGFRLAYLAQEGWINTKAIVTSLYRMFLSKQHLLEWVTAGERERRHETTRAAMFRSARASVILGAILLLFSPHLLTKLLGAVWIMVPWISSAVSDPPKIRYTRRFSADYAKKKPDGVMTADEYRVHAQRIWQFFSDTVNETTNHLPPDNVQWFPLTDKKIAMRTSPTNIGLYLCACVAACQFDLIGTDELYHRLDTAYRRICRMKRYRGHLYNWYELHRCEVIGVPYISTVDSGNFVCALLCTAAGAAAYAKTDSRFLQLAENLRRMAYETDFTFLYYKQSGQLHLGYDTEQAQLSEGRYDLYASEARSAVYFAAASGQIPALAWERLSSPITAQGRTIGSLSWSGSAFEYFMPSLWLPTPENGHAAQMLAFAFEAQADDAVRIHTEYGVTAVFGKSEGAYFGFDAARNFSYQPYGTPSLALADDRGERLCMPYALYLMLPFAPGVVRGAFDGLDQLGMRGIYGYYEALDATPMRVGGGYAVVRSYMAHHMAMSLIALANAAFDGIFQRYFMADAHMEANAVLLDQRIAADAVPTKRIDAVDHTGSAVRLDAAVPIITSHTHKEDTEPVCTVLSNSLSYLLADTAGNMTFYHGKLALTPADWSETSPVPTVFCKDMANERVYSPNARLARCGEDMHFTFREEADALIWDAAYEDGTCCQMAAHISSRGVGLQLEVSLSRHGQPIPFVLTFFVRPVLYEPYAYAVHRTFADLFLQIRRADGENRITVQRRPRSENERALCLTVCAGGLDGIQTASDASHLLPLGYTREHLQSLADADISASTSNSAVTPLLLLRGYVPIGVTALTLSLGEEPPQFDRALIARVRREAVLLCGGATGRKHVSEMLSAIAHRRKTKLIGTVGRIRPIRSPRGKERLWKYGISGDLPYFCVMAGGHDADWILAGEVLSAWKYLLLCGVRCDLILCVHETDAYGSPTERRFSDEITRQGLSYFLKSSEAAGTIHICRRRDAENDGLLLTAAHVFAHDTEKPPVKSLAPTVAVTEVPQQITRYTLDARRIVVTKGKQPMPWSFVLSNGVFSTLLTTNTLGFTFFENARECRVTPWYGDAASERCGEFLLLRFAGTDAYCDLCCTSQSVVITEGAVHYLGMIGTLSYRISVSIPSRMRHKRMELRFKNEGTETLCVQLRYQAEPLFGVVREDGEVL